MIEGLRYWSTLSDTERERLKAATVRYERVQEMNLERAWMQQTEQEREENARPYLWKDMGVPEREKWLDSYRSDPKGVWTQKCSGLARLMNGGLCGKSSLLDRLIGGGRPLVERPPTSYSYPWYSAVESSGPQVTSVSMGGAMTLGAMMRGAGGARGNSETAVGHLVINQTLFAITGANAAGEDLLRSARALLQTPDGTTEVEDWSGGARSKKTIPTVTRSHSGWGAVLAAYRAGPEIEVKHGSWPAWKLHLGRRSGCADGRWAREAVEKPPFSQLRNLDPMDLLFANLDAKLVDRDDDEAADDQYVEEAVRRIRNVLNGVPAEDCTDQVKASEDDEEQRRNLAYLETTCWHMSKGDGWAALSEEEMYLKL